MRGRNRLPYPIKGEIKDASGSRWRTLQPGEIYDFSDVCQLVHFVNTSGTSAAGAADKVNKLAETAGCAERLKPQPIIMPDGEGLPPLPNDNDSPLQQQAPNGQLPFVVTPDQGPYGRPGDYRTPTDALHDPLDPQTPGDIVDGLISKGATPPDANKALEDALKGEPPEGEARTTHGGNQTLFRSEGGDPVDLYSGLLTISAMDLEVPTPFMGLQLQRQYRSGRPYFGPWGFNWDHNWNIYLRELANGDVARWNGRLHEDVFRKGGADYVPPRGVFEKLVSTSSVGKSYEILSPGGVVSRFAQPLGWSRADRVPLISITDRAGNTIQLAYDGEDRLASVIDADARGLFFRYGNCGFLEEVRDQTGRATRYYHDEIREHLIAADLPATSDFPKGTRTQYEYAPPTTEIGLRHNVVRVLDHDENTILETSYGEDPAELSYNRVVRQVSGGFSFEFTYTELQWLPDTAEFAEYPTIQTTTAYPDGSLWTYSFNSCGELIDERFRLNHDGSFRVVRRKRQYDSQGNLKTLIAPDGSATHHTYDDLAPDPRDRGNLLKIEMTAPATAPSPSRIKLRLQYTDYQLPNRLRYENGAETRLFYDFEVAPGPGNIGALVRMAWPDATLPDGTVQTSVTQFEANGRGQVTAVISPEGRRDESIHHPAGSPLAGFLRESRADVNGANEITRFAYDAIGYRKSRTDPGGAVTETVYNAQGQLEREALPAVADVVDDRFWRYNAQGRPIVGGTPRGAFTDGTIAGAHIIETIKLNPLGHALERVLAANTASPRKITYKPDFQGRAIFTREPSGAVTRTCYDERGLLLFVTRGDGTPEAITTRYLYDLMGRRIKETAPGERVTRFYYDAWGRLTRTELPGGSVHETTWNNQDLPMRQQVIGPPAPGLAPRVLQRTRYEYDSRGRLLREHLESFETDVNAATTITMVSWYDRDGRCVRRDGPRGARWTFAYDGLGRLLKSTDPLSNAQHITYGVDGMPRTVSTEAASLTGPSQIVVEHTHDARRRLERVLSSSGQEATTRFDARDLPIESEDDAGVRCHRRYGAFGDLLESVIDPGGLDLRTTYAYETGGQMGGVTDPTGESITASYDTLGRLLGYRLSDGAQYGRVYDAAGDLVRISTPDGSTIHMQYDGAGRLSRVSTAAGTGRLPVAPHQYGYDGLGRMVSATSGTAEVKRKYDSLGRQIEETFGGQTFTRTYEDLVGRYALTYPGGRSEIHEWDLLGRVTKVRLASAGSFPASVAGTTGTTLLSLAYRGTNRTAQIVHGNGVTSDFIHDECGRVIRVEHAGAASLASVRYRHDKSNRRRVIQNGTQNLLFDYDARGRLTRWRGGFALPALGDHKTQALQDADVSAALAAAPGATTTESYVLDSSDTRTSVDGTPYSVGQGHQVIKVGADSLTYDPDGMRLSDAGRTYQYDALGRLARIARGGTTTEYAFDPVGRRFQTSVGPTTETWRSFGNQVLAIERGGRLVAQRSMIPQLMLPLIETRSDRRLHFHASGHEDLILVTDGGAAPLERYAYHPFGAPRFHDPAGASRTASAIGVEPIFGGMPFVPSVGHYFTPLRHYDPATGLFLGRDPLPFQGSPSPYVFGVHDPVNLMDPTGALPALLVAGLVVGGIGAVIGAAGAWANGGDTLDILAGAAIGFGAGFVTGVTFGEAATVLGGEALVGSASLGLTGTTASGGVSATTMMGAGGISGLAGGMFSGFSTANYQYARYGGEWGPMVADSTIREGGAGTVGGVFGGLFHGLFVRAGTIPRGSWSALQGTSQATTRAQVLPGTIARGVAGSNGLGAPVGGFASGYTSGMTRHLMEGASFEDSAELALTDGYWGAGASSVGTALHPTSWVYWRSRLSADAAYRINITRAGGAHHQRSVATYPEFATPNLDPNATFRGPSRFTYPLTPFERWYGKNMIGGNLQGRFSEYNGVQADHIAMHELWRFGQTGTSWTNIRTHGPWTPAWDVARIPIFPRPFNHKPKGD
jgi:RHS repeat-associated protein